MVEECVVEVEEDRPCHPLTGAGLDEREPPGAAQAWGIATAACGGRYDRRPLAWSTSRRELRSGIGAAHHTIHALSAVEQVSLNEDGVAQLCPDLLRHLCT